MPSSMRRNVVLPQPEAPTIVTNSWSATSRRRFSSTTCAPYCFHTLRTDTRGHQRSGSAQAKGPRAQQPQQPGPVHTASSVIHTT